MGQLIKEKNMSQIPETSLGNNEFGRLNARRIVAALGGQMKGPKSNECEVQGRRIVIKCARLGSRCSVEVTPKTLARIDAVLGAFLQEGGVFHLYELTADQYRQAISPTRLQKESDKGLKVSQTVFRKKGKRLPDLKVEVPAAAVQAPAATPPPNNPTP
jgi:hypothetical protein